MKTMTILIVAIVLLAIGSGFLLGFPGLEIGYNPNTDCRNLTYHGCGQFDGRGGTTVAGGNELLNDDEYILSWSPTLEGQRITVGGKITGGSFGAVGVEGAEYRLFREPGHKPLAVLQTTFSLISTYPAYALARDYLPKNETAEGILQAEFWVHPQLHDWEAVAVDQAKLLSGIGVLNRDRDQAAIGETACFNYRVGYVSDPDTGKGWTVDIYSLAQNKIVKGPEAVMGLSGSICYTVQTADFSSTVGVRNEVRATLRNELWDKAFDVTTTIDEPGAGPVLTITGFDPANPEQGDTVTITWTVAPGPSGSPIAKVIVQWGFGGVDQEQQLSSGATEYSFVAGQAGKVRAIVIAYDENNRPSPTDSVDISVGEPEPPSPLNNLPWWVGAIVAIVVLLIGVAFVLKFAKKLGFIFSIVGVAISVLLAVVAYVLLGGVL